MTVEDIIEIIETQHGGGWWGLFHATETGHKFLPTGHVLTPAAYLSVVRHFGGQSAGNDLTPAQRKINTLRAKAGGECG